jgi:hypothetical protein
MQREFAVYNKESNETTQIDRNIKAEDKGGPNHGRTGRK